MPKAVSLLQSSDDFLMIYPGRRLLRSLATGYYLRSSAVFQADTFAGLGKSGGDTLSFGPRITWAHIGDRRHSADRPALVLPGLSSRAEDGTAGSLHPVCVADHRSHRLPLDRPAEQENVGEMGARRDQRDPVAAEYLSSLLAARASTPQVLRRGNLPLADPTGGKHPDHSLRGERLLDGMASQLQHVVLHA